MSSFPGSPQVMKGAIIGLDPFNPLASITLFQYNPDTMTRTLQPQTSGGEGRNHAEPLRLKGAPTETITLTVEIDASDQLESADGLTVATGIYPQLSSLEMLVYPKSALVIANTILLLAGTVEIIPPEAPLTLFIWGPKRVLPVRMTSFSITEEAYDVNLNPIRAKAALGMKVLSYNDLSVTSPAYYVFLAHQVIKEAMATANGIGSIAHVGSLAVSGSISIGG